MTPNLRRLVAASALLALVLVGCGGDDNGDDESSPTTAEATATSRGDDDRGTTVPDDDDDADDTPADPQALEQARSAALTADDLPDGWVLVDETEDTEDLGGDDEGFEDCPTVGREIEAIREEGGDPADVSRSFAAESGTPTLESSPAKFADVTIAERAYAVLVSDELVECVGTYFARNRETEQGAEVGEPQIESLEIDAGAADQAGGLVMRVPMSVQGQDMVVQFDIVAIRAGAIVHSLLAISVDEVAPFPELLDVVGRAVERTAAAAKD